MTNKPLAGINVLDMSWFGAGPIAGRALANAGARVIKLETEKRIDGLRAMAPRPKGARGYNLSGYFNNYNSDKDIYEVHLSNGDAKKKEFSKHFKMSNIGILRINFVNHKYSQKANNKLTTGRPEVVIETGDF